MNNRKYTILIASVFFLAVIFQGCLSVEKKEYLFKLSSGRSGEGVVKYVNILSNQKDSLSTTENDYDQLITNYIKSNSIDEEFPGARITSKRLFEENGKLCGEVKFQFEDITTMKFYCYKDSGPWCYFVGMSTKVLLGTAEDFLGSNGIFGGDNVPVIFWDGAEKEFKFETKVTKESSDTKSLLEIWKKKGEK